MTKPLQNKKDKTFADRTLEFYEKITIGTKLPRWIDVMNPFPIPEVRVIVTQFLKKFFEDNRKRVFIFGINPGRFGGGVTGVSFTDPVALQDICGIPNHLPRIREVSSTFVYHVIEEFGGPKKFFKAFFLTAVSPLGFTNKGVNYNYYDDPKLYRLIEPFIVRTLKEQINLGADRRIVVILGNGKNQKFFSELNNEHRLFDRIVSLEHPRFVMQYRRKYMSKFIQKYVDILKSITV